MHQNDPLLVWFRNNLRLYDNKTLELALAMNRPVVLVYVMEEEWFTDSGLGFSRMGTHRLHYLHHTLFQFRKSLAEHGHHLWVVKGNSDIIIPQIGQFVGAKQAITTCAYAPEEIARQNGVMQKIPLRLVHDDLLHAPEMVGFEIAKSPYYYTNFYKKVVDLPVHTCCKYDISQLKAHVVSSIPFSPVLLDNLDTPFVALVGEEAAHASIENYLYQGHLNHYVLSRELFEGDDASTRWSPYLALGNISIRQVMSKVDRFKPQNEQEIDSVRKLREQLIWREYYRYLMMRYGKALFLRHGLRNPNRARHDDFEAFELWRQGNTGEPLVDAFMHELQGTGWMSNRGRMLAAYYLAKVLEVNWVWGALWFESMLIDYDVYNNYGNWAYQAGTGTDSRVNRRFNLERQIEKFDPRRSYLEKWQS